MSFSGGRKRRIRYFLFAGLIVLTAVFQHTGFIPELSSVPAMALVPLCVCIAMHERSIPGLFFGLLCGVLWDFASAAGDGFFSVTLAATGFVTGAIITFFMRKNIYSCLLLSFLAVGVCNISYWLLFIVRKGFEGASVLLWKYYVPSMFYTLIFAVLFYYIVGFIVKQTKEKQKHLN